MAHDVFISHSTEDKPAADAVCAILEKNGVRCWIAPRDIIPGADWGESIVNGIRSSRVLLLVFSTNANKSKQIKREVEIAADGGVTIVPLRIENILPTESFKYFLGNIHWLDALTPPLEKHLQEVATKVKAILSTGSAGPPEASQPSSQAKAPTIQQPPRRNLLPVIGGIVVVLIATSVLLFFWRWSSVSPVSEPCSKRPGYPLGHWEVGTQNASAATYATFATFTTSTSGTWLPSSGKGSFEASVPPAPGKAVVITFRVEGGIYKSESQLVVSADGCSMTGTFLDSEGHTGEAIYRWQGVR